MKWNEEKPLNGYFFLEAEESFSMAKYSFNEEAEKREEARREEKETIGGPAFLWA